MSAVQMTNNAARAALVALMVVGGLALWIGVPAGILWALGELTDTKSQHLLLGLLAVSQGVAARSLTDMGVTRDAVVAKLQRGEGGRRRGHLPFSPLARQALEATPQIAMTMAHNYVGTEHLLLALFRVRDGLAATVLAELGVTEDAVRADVVQRLARMAS